MKYFWMFDFDGNMLLSQHIMVWLAGRAKTEKVKGFQISDWTFMLKEVFSNVYSMYSY